MMVVELVRYTFEHDTSWEIVNRDVPLGTRYYVYYTRAGFTLGCLETGKTKQVTCYFLVRQGDEEPGYLPVDAFKVVES